jgi:hypothetical protein
MDDSNINPENFKFKLLSVSKEEMDYLSQRWEIRDHSELFSWSIKLLYDLSKLDESGWRLFLQKCEFDADNKMFILDENYTSLGFLIEWLAPTNNGFMRLPKLESLEEATRVKKNDEKD